MEKQYSVQFFTSFVDGLQRTCQNYVTFGQMVEVSGYLSLEIDGVKKERYVLCELIQTTGNVISESYCTKVSRNCSTGVRPQDLRRNASQVGPAGWRNVSQPSSGGNRMGLNNTNTPGQSQPVNRIGQGQQINRTVPIPQGNKTGQKQQFARPAPVAGNSARQSFELNRQDNQSPQLNPEVNRQRQSSSYSFQANQQNNGRLQMADSANRQTLTPRVNRSASNQLGGQTVQTSNSFSQGKNFQQMPRNKNVTDSARMVQQNQLQSRQMNSPVPPATQQVALSGQMSKIVTDTARIVQQNQSQSRRMNSLVPPVAQQVQLPGQTNGRLDVHVDVMQTQTNSETNQESGLLQESAIVVQGDQDDICVVAVTSGKGSFAEHSAQSHAANPVGTKGILSNRSGSEGQKKKNNHVSQTAPAQSDMTPVSVVPAQTQMTQHVVGVPHINNSTQIRKLLPIQEPNNFPRPNVDPSPEGNSQQNQTLVSSNAPLRRRDSVGSDGSGGSAMTSLVVEMPLSQNMCARKPVFLDNQHQNQPVPTSFIAQSNSASFDNLMKEIGDLDNTDEELSLDIGNESSLETSNSVGRSSKDKVSFHTGEYPTEHYTHLSERNQPCSQTSTRELSLSGSYPSIPSVSHVSQTMTNVPFLAPPGKRASSISPVPPAALSCSASPNIPQLVPIVAKISSITDSSVNTFQPTTSEQSHDIESGLVKKIKLCTEEEKEDITQSTSTSLTQSVTKKVKPAKRTARKPKEKTEKKGRKGKRKPSKPKKVDPNDTSSEEDHGEAAVLPANRTLRSARNPVKRLYTDDDYLSDGLTEFLLKETDSNNSQEAIKE